VLLALTWSLSSSVSTNDLLIQPRYFWCHSTTIYSTLPFMTPIWSCYTLPRMECHSSSFDVCYRYILFCDIQITIRALLHGTITIPIDDLTTDPHRWSSTLRHLHWFWLGDDSIWWYLGDENSLRWWSIRIGTFTAILGILLTLRCYGYILVAIDWCLPSHSFHSTHSIILLHRTFCSIVGRYHTAFIRDAI